MGGMGNFDRVWALYNFFFIIYMHAIVKNKVDKRNMKHVPFTKAQF